MNIYNILNIAENFHESWTQNELIKISHKVQHEYIMGQKGVFYNTLWGHRLQHELLSKYYIVSYKLFFINFQVLIWARERLSDPSSGKKNFENNSQLKMTILLFPSPICCKVALFLSLHFYLLKPGSNMTQQSRLIFSTRKTKITETKLVRWPRVYYKWIPLTFLMMIIKTLDQMLGLALRIQPFYSSPLRDIFFVPHPNSHFQQHLLLNKDTMTHTYRPVVAFIYFSCLY